MSLPPLVLLAGAWCDIDTTEIDRCILNDEKETRNWQKYPFIRGDKNWNRLKGFSSARHRRFFFLQKFNDVHFSTITSISIHRMYRSNSPKLCIRSSPVGSKWNLPSKPVPARKRRNTREEEEKNTNKTNKLRSSKWQKVCLMEIGWVVSAGIFFPRLFFGYCYFCCYCFWLIGEIEFLNQIWIIMWFGSSYSYMFR